MHFRTVALLLVLIFSSSAYAQSNFKKGYFISLQGDTIQGYIEYKEWTRTPAYFIFKSSLTEKAILTHTVHSAHKFVVEGFESYERFKVSLSMNEKDFNTLDINLNTPNRTDTVFLKVITRGDRINLYSYRDELKERFYVLVPAQTTPVELNLRHEMHGTQIATLYLYRQQLNRIALDYPAYTPELKRLIESASYSKTSLKKIVSKINSINEKEFAFGEELYKKGISFASVGLNYSNLTYKGQSLINASGLDNSGNPTYKNETMTHSYLPEISIGYDLFFHPAIQRSYLRAEVISTAIQSKVTSLYKFPRPYDEELTNEYKLFGVFLALNPQFIYNLYQQNKLKIYAGIGFSLRYSFYPTNTLNQYTNKQGPGYSDKEFQNYFKMKSFSVIPIVRTGAIINKKFNASLTLYNASELTDLHRAPQMFVRERSVHFSLAYVF